MIHETSIIDKGAKIGENTKIWHFCHVSKDAIIGNNCILGQNIFIGHSVKIGNNVKIQNNVSIYNGVTIEDDVFLGPSMVFTNVNNPRSKFPKKNEFKATLVKRGASIGANATIICGYEIGNYAFIGAGSVVKKNVKNYSIEVGNPSNQIGWMDEFGNRIDLPIKGNGNYINKFDQKYFLKNDYMFKE